MKLLFGVALVLSLNAMAQPSTSSSEKDRCETEIKNIGNSCKDSREDGRASEREAQCIAKRLNQVNLASTQDFRIYGLAPMGPGTPIQFLFPVCGPRTPNEATGLTEMNIN